MNENKKTIRLYKYSKLLKMTGILYNGNENLQYGLTRYPDWHLNSYYYGISNGIGVGAFPNFEDCFENLKLCTKIN